MHHFGSDVNVFYAVFEKGMIMGGKDFYNVKEWLQYKLAERKMSTNRFVLLTGNKVTNATIFRWYNGTFSPKEETMEIVCETLSRLPILKEGEPPRFEEVPLWEGMKYTGRKS
jgi:hypothetical protein